MVEFIGGSTDERFAKSVLHSQVINKLKQVLETYPTPETAMEKIYRLLASRAEETDEVKIQTLAFIGTFVRYGISHNNRGITLGQVRGLNPDEVPGLGPVRTIIFENVFNRIPDEQA